MTTKDAGLRIRVPRELRDQFLEACRAQDKPAAQVLREFMRDYIAANAPVRQASLFPPDEQEPELPRIKEPGA